MAASELARGLRIELHHRLEQIIAVRALGHPFEKLSHLAGIHVRVVRHFPIAMAPNPECRLGRNDARLSSLAQMQDGVTVLHGRSQRTLFGLEGPHRYCTVSSKNCRSLPFLLLS